MVDKAFVVLWFPSLSPSSSLTFSPSEYAWGRTMWTCALKKIFASGKVYLMTGNITFNFGLHIYITVCICICLCSREIKGETDRDRKKNENRVTVQWICVPITTQSGVWNLDLFSCACLTVFFQLSYGEGHTAVSMPIWGTHSCFGYGEVGPHAYSTYRDTQIHPDACFGDHIDHMIWMHESYLKRSPLELRGGSEQLVLPHWTLHSFESSWHKTDELCG